MPTNFLSGTVGSVKVGATAYNFGKWRLRINTAVPKVNNFSSAYQVLVVGLSDAEVELEGPYDGGNMAFAAGTQYSFILAWSGSLSITVPTIITQISTEQNIEDAARVTITGKSTGTITLAIT